MSEDSAAGSEPGIVFDTPEEETETIPPQERLDLQFTTSPFVACLIINVVVVVIILAIVYPFLGEYKLYSQQTGFVGPELLFVGLVVSALILSFVSYHLLTYHKGNHKVLIFWSFVLLCFFLIAWFFRLGIDFDDFFNGINPNRYSTYINMAALGFSLVLLYFAFQIKWWVGLAMLVVVLWVLYLLYSTWFSLGGIGNPLPENPTGGI